MTADPRPDLAEIDARDYDGWLYFNPGAGTEWSEQNPIESGECPDAENVRPATAIAFQNELIPAWEDLARARALLTARDAEIAALTAMAERAEADLLAAYVVHATPGAGETP